MPHISLRVSEEEKELMKSYANLHGVNLSEALKAAFFEKLEDEYDMKTVEEYEKKPLIKTYTLEEVKKELGLDNDKIQSNVQ